MPGRPDYDAVILGGGLAGLSLATRLATVPGCRTLIVEPRTAYRRDRTWCYWRLHDHPFRSAVAKSWDSWTVQRPDGHGGASVALQTDATIPYDMIPADRLYASAEATIGQASHIERLSGHSALSVAEAADRVTVETTAGGVTASTVFDSRLPPGRAGDLRQRFLGLEIETASPCFDPNTVTLMDFAVPQQPGAVHFLYVLPTSPTHALVEDTWLAPAEAALPDYKASIAAYMRQRFGTDDYVELFEEEGSIPMSPGLQGGRGTGRVVPIGTAGGAVKPSSGYGFLATQRMTDAIAGDLATGRRPRPVQPRSPAARWMDSVLLNALQRNPERAPELFHSLFARCPPGSLVRFLNDLGGAADIARVIAAMPKAPMIAAAMRRLLAPNVAQG